MLSVSLSSIAAARVYFFVHDQYPTLRRAMLTHDLGSLLALLKPTQQSTWQAKQQVLREFWSHSHATYFDLLLAHKDDLVCALCSLPLFLLLGGRFRSVLPSNLTKPGAFARRHASLQASGNDYITSTQRSGARASGFIGLNDYGFKYGCHTCGTKWVTSFIGDHMPPNKYASQGQQQ